ncbi:MAG: OmpH family outer membrane protein [Bacteroidales bacterium]|nr:OmpH family outer membrane protein [Bacteroidales bacterium]
MRKSLFIILLLTLTAPVWGQKYACVNTDYILRSVPEYTQALNKINKYIEEWQQELQAKQQEVDELRQQYQQEAYLLPDNLKQRRQDEIHNKESELRALQRQRFGTGGDLEQKRAELMKPVQDRVYNAIERVAREKNFAFVFDKAASATVLYVSEKYDISNQVLEMLGVKPGANTEGAAASSPTSGSRGDKGNGGEPGTTKKPSNDRRDVKR